MLPAKRRPGFLDQFLEQERTPVYTALSILTTIAVWMIVVMDLLTKPREWGGLAQAFLLAFAIVVGSLINAFLGRIAASRGEYWGGRIAALGIGLWFLTVAVFYFVRANRLWS